MPDEPTQTRDDSAPTHQRVKEGFAQATELSPESRPAFLDEYCGGDAELRREIESLLAHADEAPTADLAPGVEPVVEPDRMVGRQLGRYSIKRVIAAGGMGVVYEAVQERPRRVVALKVMKRGIASRSALRRFEYEAQILARLRHPGIAQIYEAGVHDEDGESVPFFAMEYIPAAMPITAYGEAKKLGTRERLELFTKVCDAVQHGHGKGIIHRDLKPSNILVDSSGQPKVIDFGVARSTDSDLAVTTLQTDIGQLIGTLQYMSPEQCLADPHDLDTRSDVYALGVVLYELLCGKVPYDVSKAAVFEATRVIQETTPARPSSFSKTLRGDVETVVLKALEKDRERRYRSAAEFGEDLRHYLNDEPISAQPPSLSYQVRMFARKNRTVFRAGVAVILALVVGLGTALGGMAWALNERERAGREALTAQAAEAEQSRLAKAEAEARRVAEQQTYIASIQAASDSWVNSESRRMRQHLQTSPEYLRGWEWTYLMSAADRSIATLIGHTDAVQSVVYSPTGSHLLTASADGTARLWDAATGSTTLVLQGHTSPVWLALFSPDGALIATSSTDDTIVWNATTGIRIAAFPGLLNAFGPSSDRILTTDRRSNTVTLWNIQHRTAISSFVHTESLYRSELSPDGTRVVSPSFDSTVRLWNADTGNEIRTLQLHAAAAYAATFSPDGSLIATISEDGLIQLADGHSGSHRSSLIGSWGGNYRALFSPDGSHLATQSRDTVHLWDLQNLAANADPIALKAKDEHSVSLGSFSPDGSYMLTLVDNATAELWNTSALSLHSVLRGHQAQITSSSFSPDGSLIATASRDGTVRIWDTASPPEVLVIDTDFGSSCAWPAFSADSNSLLTWLLGYSSWDAYTGTALAPSNTPDTCAYPPLTSFDGTYGWSHGFSSAHGGEVISIARTDAATSRTIIDEDASRLTSASFAPSSAVFLTSSLDGTAKLWDVPTGDLIATCIGHDDVVNGVSMSRGGSRVITASDDCTARIWDVASCGELWVLRTHQGPVKSAHFNIDGELAVTTSADRTARLWSTSTGTELATLRGHEGSVNWACFHPSGTRVVTVSDDKTVRIWDVSSGNDLVTLRGHKGHVGRATFSDDGSRLATAAWDGTVRLWDSIPYRVRFMERMARGPDGERAVGIVESLHDSLYNWTDVADAIRQDTEITDEVRHRALGIITVRAEEERLAARGGADQ